MKRPKLTLSKFEVCRRSEVTGFRDQKDFEPR